MMAERDPKGAGRSKRRIFGREHRTRPHHGQQYIFVGLAILFLAAWFLFRDSCSKRFGQTFGVFGGQSSRDAGAETMRPRPRPRPMRPKADPDDW
jgi:hypothetical protein